MSLSEQATAGITGKPAFEFTVKRHVTRELLTTQVGVVYFIRPTAPMRIAEQDEGVTVRKRAGKAAPEAATADVAPAVPAKPAMLPPILLDITNLEDGAIQTMVVPSVLEREILRFYDNDSYVGKDFRIVKTGFKDAKAGGGQRFSLWSIQEIELPANHPLYEGPAVATAEIATSADGTETAPKGKKK